MRTILKTISLIIMCFAVIAPAASQVSGGVVTGTVTDASGANVPNVRIELENIDTGQRTGPQAGQRNLDQPSSNTWDGNVKHQVGLDNSAVQDFLYLCKAARSGPLTPPPGRASVA